MLGSSQPFLGSPMLGVMISMARSPADVEMEHLRRAVRNILAGRLGVHVNPALKSVSRDEVLDLVGGIYDELSRESEVKGVFVVFVSTTDSGHYSVPFFYFKPSSADLSSEVLQFISYFLGQGVAFYLTQVFPSSVAPCFSCPNREYCASMSVVSLFYGMASAVANPISSVEGDVSAAREHAIAYLRYLRDRLDSMLSLLERSADVGVGV